MLAGSVRNEGQLRGSEVAVPVSLQAEKGAGVFSGPSGTDTHPISQDSVLISERPRLYKSSH